MSRYPVTPKGSDIPAQGNALGWACVWNRALKGCDKSEMTTGELSVVREAPLPRKSGGIDDERYAGSDAFDVTPFQG